MKGIFFEMKILHVITSLLTGGAETLVSEMLPRFRIHNVLAELAVFNAVETPLMEKIRNDGIIIHRFGPVGCNTYSPSNLLKLQRLVGNGNFDIVHTHNTACQLFGALCRKPKATKLITTEHNTSNRRRSHGLMKHLDRLMYAPYDKIVCVSAETRDGLTGFLGDRIAEKCEVIPNGIDLAKFHSEIKCPSPGDEINIIMVAGFRMQKDQDTAVRAIAALPQRFRLSLAGDGARIGEVKRLADSLGVIDRVKFLGLRTDVPELLPQSDIVLMSSHYEGLSLSNIEGMASGRPFVASDVPGLRDFTQGAGILFKEGDHEELARILMSLAEDSNLYVSTAGKCRERAMAFDIDTTTRRHVALYGRVLS